MKSYLPLLLLPAAALVLALTQAQGSAPSKPAVAMAKAANTFLDGLSSEQKAKATFTFTDAERKNWHFVPIERKGLPLKEMDAKQKETALALFKTALSQKGYLKASTIMSLEKVLLAIEKGSGPLRDPERYFVSVFGTPPFNDGKPWGWRFEGHHMAFNFTVAGGKVAATPTFFGSNPAEVRLDLEGMKGVKVLKEEEEAARALLESLTPEQKTAAVFDTKAPNDIITFDKPKVSPLDSVGIAYDKLTKPQQVLLTKLVEVYSGNMSSDLAKERKAKLTKADKSKVVFAWAGGTARGEKHYYRVQGPTFLIEYDNTQNDGNHVHSVWRDFNGDFGDDLIAEHYAAEPHGQ